MNDNMTGNSNSNRGSSQKNRPPVSNSIGQSYNMNICMAPKFSKDLLKSGAGLRDSSNGIAGMRVNGIQSSRYLNAEEDKNEHSPIVAPKTMQQPSYFSHSRGSRGLATDNILSPERHTDGQAQQTS